ncbi:MAG: cation diffusion facilitator family transporter [Clostridia bacterium]|nr:cation diffusion facilitator family transporter [Clostridia bacterium]
MTGLLIKLFIKNSEDIINPRVRKDYGALSGGVGIVCNIILFLIKLMTGIISASISVIADAFNNLSDAASSVITIIGFKLADKPADNDHPYGHGRYEYLSGLLIAFLIIMTAVELLKGSVDKILHPEAVEFSFFSVIILVFSICLKMWMALFNKKIGRKLNASAMLATAADSLSDCIATGAVLLSLIIGHIFNINIDGYTGILVALFVFKAGIEAASDTLQPLLGQAPDPEFVKALEEDILSEGKIKGIHDMHIHDYGPGRVIVSLHAEIPAEMNVMEAHDIIDNTEERIKRKYKCEISIHMDPIETENESVNELKNMIDKIINEINPILHFHDFRVTNGPMRTNIIFDLEVPFDFELKDNEIIRNINEKVKEIDETYYIVVQVDKVVINN